MAEFYYPNTNPNYTILACYTTYTMSSSACPDSRCLGLVEVLLAHPILPMLRVLAAPLHTAVGSSPVHAAVAAPL